MRSRKIGLPSRMTNEHTITTAPVAVLVQEDVFAYIVSYLFRRTPCLSSVSRSSSSYGKMMIAVE